MVGFGTHQENRHVEIGERHLPPRTQLQLACVAISTFSSLIRFDLYGNDRPHAAVGAGNPHSLKQLTKPGANIKL